MLKVLNMYKASGEVFHLVLELTCHNGFTPRKLHEPVRSCCIWSVSRLYDTVKTYCTREIKFSEGQVKFHKVLHFSDHFPVDSAISIHLILYRKHSVHCFLFK